MIKQLKEELGGFAGKKRRYLLMRIAGVDSTAQAIDYVKANKHLYNKWCTDPKFSDVHKRVLELKKEYREEALRELRKENQFTATMLESDIIEKLREEIQTGDYKLLRTHLGREVYAKLMAELDKAPTTQNQLTWYDKVIQLTGQKPNEITDGGTVHVLSEPAGCTET